MEPNESATEQQDLFDSLTPKLVQASHGKRLVNYLADMIVFDILFAIILAIAANSYAPLQDWLVNTLKAGGITYTEQLILLVTYGTYMFIIEAALKGKSVGKFITGTRVVRRDGTPIAVRDAQLRGLFRMIPFHQFSALGMPCYPWHDRWSKTLVIDEKASDYRVPS
jgi:uncharacterized RDD family membrane protein YckC